MKLNIPDFETKKELFDFLVANKVQLMDQKKSTIKLADGIGVDTIVGKDVKPGEQTKANPTSNLLDKDYIEVKVVINTTNIMDSHKDVHIPGIWDKSLQENKRIMHIQEHKSHEFKSIISSGDDLKAYVKTQTWKSLGLNAEGSTQALKFDSIVRKERNEEMFKLYARKLVDNHSVGMRYVKLVMCIDDEDYGAEKEAFDKYYPMVINKSDVDQVGYFWAVTEAKVIEGSAVPNGSNPITPTESIKIDPIISAKQLALNKFLNL